MERRAATFQGLRHLRLALLARSFVEIGHAVLGARRCRERSHRQHRCSPHLRFGGNESQTTLHNPTGNAIGRHLSTCPDDEIVSGLSEPGKAEADLLSTTPKQRHRCQTMGDRSKQLGHVFGFAMPLPTVSHGRAGGSYTNDWMSVLDAAPSNTLSKPLAQTNGLW